MTTRETLSAQKEALLLSVFTVRGLVIITETLKGITTTRIVPLVEDITPDDKTNKTVLKPMSVSPYGTRKLRIHDLKAVEVHVTENDGFIIGNGAYHPQKQSPITQSPRCEHIGQKAHAEFCLRMKQRIMETYDIRKKVEVGDTVQTTYFDNGEEKEESRSGSVVEQTQTAFFTTKGNEPLIVDLLFGLKEEGMLDELFTIPTPENTES